jgi:hypothetical protein
MAKFECLVCGEKLEIAKHTIKVLDGKVVSPEAMCCDKYMKGIRENEGLGTVLSRPGGKVRGKNGLNTD